MSKKRRLDENNTPSNEFKFVDKLHSSILLSEMDCLRKDGKFCDVTIECANYVTFRAHKSVLTSFSLYFKGMFENECLETKENVIPLKDVKAEAMELLLDYMYKGYIQITSENCKNVLEVAHYFSVVPLIDAVCQFLENQLNKYNCFEIFNFAELYSLMELKLRAFDFALQNFSSVIKYAGFLELSADNLISFISDDRLEVDKEEFVFLAVKKWFEKDPEGRMQNLFRVLERVRLPLADEYFLYDCVEMLPAIKQNPECMQLIEEAKHFLLLPNRHLEIMFTERTRPRNNAGTMQVIILLGGSNSKRKYLRSAECYSFARNEQFNIKTKFPIAICYHSVISSGKSIYMMGGCSSSKILNQLWKYDVISNNWLKMCPMPIRRYNFGVATVDNDIYVIGGYNDSNSYLDSVERYNLSSNIWSSVRKLRTPLSQPTVITYDQKIYVAGGANLQHPFGTRCLYRYSSETNKWDELKPMLVPKWGAAGCALDGCIYIFGGYDSKQVLQYDIKNNIWKEVARMVDHRANFGVTILNKKIYLIGGVKVENVFNENIDCYDPVKNAWDLKCDRRILNGRESFGCVSMNIQKSICQLIKQPRDSSPSDSSSSMSSTSVISSDTEPYFSDWDF